MNRWRALFTDGGTAPRPGLALLGAAVVCQVWFVMAVAAFGLIRLLVPF